MTSLSLTIFGSDVTLRYVTSLTTLLLQSPSDVTLLKRKKKNSQSIRARTSLFFPSYINYYRYGMSFFAKHPNVVLLGSPSVKRLPIFSFLIRHPRSGLFLHYNFVSMLLNDLFGIQSRGGCACAGPYAQVQGI